MTTHPTIQPRLCACPDCDLLIARDERQATQDQRCPRCGAVVWYGHRGDSPLTLSAALTGLILFFPAIALPVLTVDMLGQHGAHSLLSGVERLFSEGETALALLVLLCSVVAPLLQLCCIAVICLCMKSGRRPALFPLLVRASHSFQEWSMLEVFAMGVLVAYIKMMDPGEVGLAAGALCLTGLLLSVILTSQHFHQERAWQYWGQGQ